MVNSCTKFKLSSISRLGDISYNIGCTIWWQSEICIVINDKSQGSIGKHLSYDGLLYCKYVIQFAGKRIFKNGEHLAKLHTGKMID